MLNRVKISTSLIILLVILLTFQVLSSGLSIRAQSTSNDALETMTRLNNRADFINQAWASMLESRVTINRSSRSLTQENNQSTDPQVRELLIQAESELKDSQRYWNDFQNAPSNPLVTTGIVDTLAKDFDAYAKGLSEVIQLLKTNDINGFLEYPTQVHHDAFESSLSEYRKEVERISNYLATQTEQSSNTAFWSTLGLLMVTTSIIIISLYGIKTILIAPMNKILDGIKSISGGDLITSIGVEGTNEMGQIATRLRDMQKALAKTVGEVRTGANAIYTGATEIANGNSDLSARTEQQAASLEETAASMEELTATVKQNAENAQQASQLAHSASETAGQGGKVVENVVMTMNDIADSSQKIAEITSVIDGIAFQTNILALNAAVEAARAGEQGRGFAVVASEVRNLAQRSAQAAKEIKTLIDESVNKISCGAKFAENAGETMGDIINAISNVTDIMNEIACASEEQSNGIQQVGIAVAEMDRVTQQNTSLVEESAAASAELEAQASRLNKAVAVFHISEGLQDSYANELSNRTVEKKSPRVLEGSKTRSLVTTDSSKENDSWEQF
ncbi:methyl-accepting chemotaxis protein II [Citrobacter amalonaticus]|uniref:Methyl-accepting chemotaxis protein II n=1 Tax=Citrobacter amalonaticus TaxID=35703 RepID=A0A2S4RPU9_CITAM|nr:methyl-accepting chemotaxis protein [Citrobacter amalonaticus]POT54783.1 methyl-accepting chemotaxis protein II [Citrobacter amalonaticus]POT68955.1 methyl-accepting chemotaxis protein II [Citrobacter amalonaticus]POU59093.1 methyl-accepting chemotaxis protein II [Citrobacter amalonaticus]POV02303.1 methyl-accepting chemotaxis protein II [Citrobacter amalonaticus]